MNCNHILTGKDVWGYLVKILHRSLSSFNGRSNINLALWLNYHPVVVTLIGANRKKGCCFCCWYCSFQFIQVFFNNHSKHQAYTFQFRLLMRLKKTVLRSLVADFTRRCWWTAGVIHRSVMHYCGRVPKFVMPSDSTCEEEFHRRKGLPPKYEYR